jgi:ATP-binding cassette subfamily C protein
MDGIFSIEKESNGEMKLNELSTILLEKVTYTYPDQSAPVLKDISAEFKRGTITLMTGKNGSGKTTMVNVILGILQNIQDGNVKYDSVKISNIDMYSMRNEKIATLLQDNHPPDVTAYEYLSGYFSLDKEGIVNVIKMMSLNDMFLTKNFDISNLWDIKINTMSGGERQKIRLIKVLCGNKDAMILDEPSTGLDAHGVNSLIQYLNRTRNNRVCIIVSHDPRFEDISDSIIRFEIPK